MKIIGIGVDIVKNARMKRILETPYSLRFQTKVLHPNEIIALSELKQKQEQFLASRWAIKEALVKASANTELVFPFIEIAKFNKMPIIKLHDVNQQYFLKKFGNYQIHMSISHEDEFSIGFVTISIEA